jgi:hypothetical protein
VSNVFMDFTPTVESVPFATTLWTDVFRATIILFAASAELVTTSQATQLVPFAQSNAKRARITSALHAKDGTSSTQLRQTVLFVNHT